MTSKLFRPGVYWRSLLLVAGASLALVAAACASGTLSRPRNPLRLRRCPLIQRCPQRPTTSWWTTAMP